MPDNNLAEAVEDAQLENQEISISLAVQTLSGDIRDAMLTRIRDEKPWAQKDEFQQRSTIQQITASAEHMVRQVVKVVASAGLPAMSGTLDSVGVKGTMKAVIVLGKASPERHNLIDAQGTEVVIVLANPSAFFGERAAVRASKDQPDLPLDGAAPHQDAPTYTVAGAQSEMPFPDLIAALAEAGAAVLEPRQVHASNWGMSKWAVLLDADEKADGDDATDTPKRPSYRLFDSMGEAMAFCEKAKDMGQEKALEELLAAGEPTPIGGEDVPEKEAARVETAGNATSEPEQTAGKKRGAKLH